MDKELLKEKTLRNLRLLREELRLRPDDFFCHFNVSRCYGNLRLFEKAMEHLERVIQNPAARQENPDLYFYEDPLFLFEKLEISDVIITPHWRSINPKIDQSNFDKKVYLWTSKHVPTNGNHFFGPKWGKIGYFWKCT